MMGTAIIIGVIVLVVCLSTFALQAVVVAAQVVLVLVKVTWHALQLAAFCIWWLFDRERATESWRTASQPKEADQ